MSHPQSSVQRVRVSAASLCMLPALLTLLLAFPVISPANDYFISPTGNDDNPGTEALPWQSIHRINIATLKPGDNIFLERGGIWRETLEVPSSGAEGKPISFGAYPDRPELPRPVIACTSDITEYLWEGIIANGGFEDTLPAQPCESGIPGWSVRSSGGHQCTISVSTGNNTLKLTNLGGNTDAVTNQFKLKAGHNYILEGRIKSTNMAHTHVFLYNSAPDNHYLSLDNTGNSTWVEMDNANVQPPLFSSSKSTWETLSIPFKSRSDSIARIRISVRNYGGTAFIDDFKIRDLDRKYWTVSTREVGNPQILTENGIRLSRGKESDNDARWYFVGGPENIVRYLPLTTEISEHIEIGSRRTGILVDNKSWIRISDMEVRGCEAPHGDPTSNGAAILLSNGSSNNIIRNMRIINNAHGIRAQGKSKDGSFISHNIIEDNEIAYGISQGISLRSETSDNLIRGNFIHHLNYLHSDDDGKDKEAISLGGNTGNGEGNIVELNRINNIGTGANGSIGIIVFNTPGTVIRNNNIYAIGAAGIGVGSNGKSPYGYRSDNTLIYSNIVSHTGLSPRIKRGQGIFVMVSDYADIDGTGIYNNTIADCELDDSKDGGISIRGVANPDGSVNTISNTNIFNNIIADCRGKFPHALFIGSEKIVNVTNIHSDYNLFYPSPSTPGNSPTFSFKGKKFTARHKYFYSRETGLDINSQIASPGFINKAARNFQLRADSPAIKAGKHIHAIPELSDISHTPNIGATQK